MALCYFYFVGLYEVEVLIINTFCTVLHVGYAGYVEDSNYRQATKAMVFVVPGLGLGSPLKNSYRLCDFLMEVPFTGMKMPFTKDKWLCPFNKEI